MNKKMLLLAGIAGYAYYRYSKMSSAEKTALKDKTRKLVENYLPEDLKNLFGMDSNSNVKTDNPFFKAGL